MADVQIAERLAVAVGTRRGRAAADQLCEACVDLLSVDAAAISVIFGGSNAGTLGASDAPARVYDEVQFTLGEGPCLDSVTSHAPILVADLAEAPPRAGPPTPRRCSRTTFTTCRRYRSSSPANTSAPWTCSGSRPVTSRSSS